MQPEARKKYGLYLFIILAGVLMSLILLEGPLQGVGQDLAAPVLKKSAKEKASREQLERVGVLYFVIFLGLTISGAHIAARFLSDSTKRKRDNYVREVRWSIPDSIVLTFLFMTLPFLFSFLVSLVGGSDARKEFSVGDALASTVSSLFVLFLGIRILNQKGGSFREGMGLVLRPRFRLVLMGAAAFLAFWPFRVMYTTATLAFFHFSGLRIKEHPVVEELLIRDRTYLKIALIFSVAVCAPLFEEIFFRGFLYQGLRRRMDAWAAILATSLLFASIHPSVFQASIIFPLGLLLAYLMEKTGSIIPGMIVHFLTNGTTLALLFLVPR